MVEGLELPELVSDRVTEPVRVSVTVLEGDPVLVEDVVPVCDGTLDRTEFGVSVTDGEEEHVPVALAVGEREGEREDVSDAVGDGVGGRQTPSIKLQEHELHVGGGGIMQKKVASESNSEVPGGAPKDKGIGPHSPGLPVKYLIEELEVVSWFGSATDASIGSTGLLRDKFPHWGTVP